MEDNLKILEVEYLSNCLVDHTQIWNLDSGNHLKILKVENLSNHLLDPTQILNLSLYDQF